MQGIRQGVEDAEAAVGSGGLRCSRSAICREAHGEGLRPGAGLPYLHAHFLRIREKQSSVWHQIPPWERLYTHLVEAHTHLGLYITSWGSDARNPAIKCEHCWSFSAETRDRLQGGVGGRK